MKIFTKVALFSGAITLVLVTVCSIGIIWLLSWTKQMLASLELTNQLYQLNIYANQFQLNAPQMMYRDYNKQPITRSEILQIQKELTEGGIKFDRKLANTLAILDIVNPGSQRNPSLISLTSTLHNARQVNADFVFYSVRWLNQMALGDRPTSRRREGELSDQLSRSLKELSIRSDIAINTIQSSLQIRMIQGVCATLFAICTVWLINLLGVVSTTRSLRATLIRVRDMIETIRKDTSLDESPLGDHTDELSSLKLSAGHLADALRQAKATVQNRERELEEKAVQLKQLSGKLLQTREEALKRISSYVHDELGQYLTGAKLDVLALEKRIGDNHSAQNLLSNLSSLLDDVLGMTRDLGLHLRPPLLDRIDFLTAIKQMINFVSRHCTTKINLDLAMGADVISHDMQVALYRVIQEGMTNMMRHANASHASVSLWLDRDCVKLRITDDGLGFDALQRKVSMGLQSIQERIDFFEGQFQIESSPGSGTQLDITVPLSTPKETL